MKFRRGLCLIFLMSLFLFLINISFSSAQTKELQVTSEHPFLVGNEWITASELKVGDELRTADGKRAIIREIEKINPLEKFLVYNLEAGKFHNFVLGEGVVVHNSNAIPSSVNPSLNRLKDGELTDFKPGQVLSKREFDVHARKYGFIPEDIDTAYRVDTRSPEELMEQGGRFTPSPNKPVRPISEHRLGGSGNFVSTTSEGLNPEIVIGEWFLEGADQISGPAGDFSKLSFKSEAEALAEIRKLSCDKVVLRTYEYQSRNVHGVRVNYQPGLKQSAKEIIVPEAAPSFYRVVDVERRIMPKYDSMSGDWYLGLDRPKLNKIGDFKKIN